MYIVTFYSFKGGVGRSLALANIGLQLANTGRRVLLVDFDLEAPGLTTFNRFKPGTATPGIVEYISEYIEGMESPDVKDYVYEIPSEGKQGGRLWVMPAGMEGREYEEKLHAINWHDLYADYDGYLMFEDMKAQWESCYKPDYVLLDSRTGHTDVGGICTRQLPNAVTILFFPNEQNLAGLKPIVAGIRAEDDRVSKETRLHFVMSNVPDLDDEKGIVSGFSRRFRDQLGYESLTSIIYRYDSLALLNQSIFVADRPNSRLAREYIRLMELITSYNMQDRKALAEYLKHPSHRIGGARGWRFRTERPLDVEEILKYHRRDGEILFLLAKEQKERGRLQLFRTLLERSLEAGYSTPEAMLEQAEINYQERNAGDAFKYLLEAFQEERLGGEYISRGIELLHQIRPEELPVLTKTPAFQSLSGKECVGVANQLNWCKAGLETIVELLSKVKADTGITIELARIVKTLVVLAYIGLSRFDEAMRLFGVRRPLPNELGRNDSFNYAIAEWGVKKTVTEDMFARTIQLDQEEKAGSSANYAQCLAIAFWAVGDKKNAIERLKIAKVRISEKVTPEFSCWRYMEVTPTEFMQDCDAIKKLIDGENVVPVFFETQKVT